MIDDEVDSPTSSTTRSTSTSVKVLPEIEVSSGGNDVGVNFEIMEVAAGIFHSELPLSGVETSGR